MRIEEFEILIRNTFKSLPKKQVFSGRKQEVWMKIQNHLRETRLLQEKSEQTRGALWNFLFLRKGLGKILATLVIVLVAVTFVRGVADAAPGEALYPVKKAAEKVEQVLATNPEAKVKIQIKHAKRRLEEVKVLVEEQKGKKIVAETLQALKDTTQEMVAASESQPELKSQVVELANHEEAVLESVHEIAANDIKDVVQEAISQSRESISKLTPVQEEETVKGATATAGPEQTTSAQQVPTEALGTTLPSKTASIAKPKRETGNAVFESKIQVHEILEPEENSVISETSPPEEVEIIVEPEF